MHLTGFNQAYTKDFCLRRVQIIFFQKWISSWFSECEYFCKNSGVFFFLFCFFASESANLTKEDLFLNFKLFFCPKIHKIPNFSDLFAQHVLVIPYCTCTANPRLHKSDNCTKMQEVKLEFVYVRRGGCVGVAQISILCKTSNFP